MPSIQSWDAVQQAIDARRPDGGKMPEGAKLTLIALCVYVGPTNGVGVYPSQATLGQRLRTTERTIRRHLATLEEWGLIEREYRQRRDGRGRTSDLVRLTFLRDQPDSSVRLVHDQPDNRDDQPDIWDDQPDSGDRTNRTHVSGEPPVEPPDKEPPEKNHQFSGFPSEMNLSLPSQNGGRPTQGRPNDKRGGEGVGDGVNGDRPRNSLSTNSTQPPLIAAVSSTSEAWLSEAEDPMAARPDPPPAELEAELARIRARARAS